MIEHPTGVAVRTQIGHGDAEMNLRRGADAEFRHASDHAGHARRLAHRNDSGSVEQPAGFGDVDIGDIGGLALNHLHRRTWIADAFISHQRNGNRAPNLRHAIEVVCRQGLLDEFKIVFFHRADDLDRLLGRLPSHIAIDTKFHIRPDRLADQLHSRDVTRRVLASDFYLDRAVSPYDPLAGQLSHIFGRPEGDRIAEWNALTDLAAKQVIDRRIERFPDDIPQRHLDAGFGLFHAIE